MKRIALTVMALALATNASAHWKFPWNRPGANPLQQLLDPNQGIPILDPADLRATVAITEPAIAAGAGLKVKALRNCSVAWLAHPEYLTPAAPPPAAPAAATVAPVGPISQAAASLVKLDADARALSKKAALFSAPVPDDIALACAPLVAALTPAGIAHDLLSILHPTAPAIGK